MTLIETDGRFVTLTTEKGKTIEVTLPGSTTPAFSSASSTLPPAAGASPWAVL